MAANLIEGARAVLFAENVPLATASLLRGFSYFYDFNGDHKVVRQVVLLAQQYFVLNLLCDAFPGMSDDKCNALGLIVVALPNMLNGLVDINKRLPSGADIEFELAPYVKTVNKVVIFICGISLGVSGSCFTGVLICTSILVAELKDRSSLMSTSVKEVVDRVIKVVDVVIVGCAGTKIMLGSLLTLGSLLALQQRSGIFNPIRVIPQEEKAYERKHVFACTDLIADCYEGKVSQCFGREKELDLFEDTLGQEGNKSVLILGPKGIGKTTLIQGLVHRRCDGSIWEDLKDLNIFKLDITELTATDGFAGRMDSKVEKFKKALKKYPNSIVVCDEIHRMIGAGTSTGKNSDLADMFKEEIEIGSIVFVGATTLQEYDRDIKSDEAFASRFAKVVLKKQTQSEKMEILNFHAKQIERNNQCTYTPSAIKEIYRVGMIREGMPRSAIKLLKIAGSAARRIASQAGENVEITKEMIEDIVYRQGGEKVDADAPHQARANRDNIDEKITSAMRRNVRAMIMQCLFEIGMSHSGGGAPRHPFAR